MRTVSPVDGVERFSAVQSVPDLPLEVLVTRDTNVALAPWRAMAWGTAARTLALAALAAILIALLMRQLRTTFDRARFAQCVARAVRPRGGRFERRHLGLGPAHRKRCSLRRARASCSGCRPVRSRRRATSGSPHCTSIRRTRRDGLPRCRPTLPAGRRCTRASIASGIPTATIAGCASAACAYATPGGRPCAWPGPSATSTRRSAREEALRLSEERYAIAMTGSNEGHWVWDIATDELYASPMVKEVFGLARR